MWRNHRKYSRPGVPDVRRFWWSSYRVFQSNAVSSQIKSRVSVGANQSITVEFSEDVAVANGREARLRQ